MLAAIDEKSSRGRGLVWFGWVLVAVWLGWWVWGCCKPIPRLPLGEKTWIGTIAWPFFGLDFLHNQAGVAAWGGGHDPYEMIHGDPMWRQYTYPPVVLPFFAWTKWLPADHLILMERPAPYPPAYVPLSYRAIFVWMGISLGIVALGAWGAKAARRELKLPALPFGLLLACMLFCYPVIFEMERGNYDVLVLLMALAAIWGLRKKSWFGDAVAGIALALASWMKIYPLLLVLGFVALRRYRAAFLMMASCAFIGLLTLPWTIQWVFVVGQRLDWSYLQFWPQTHSLSGQWEVMMAHSLLPGLARVPSSIGAGLLLMPFGLWLSWKIWRHAERDKLAFPYLMWLMGLSTFWQLVACDYNLLFLPLAALAVWQRRDSLKAHLLMVPMVLWWQPVWIPINWELFFFCKLIGMAGVCVLIVEKIQPAVRVATRETSVEGRSAVIATA